MFILKELLEHYNIDYTDFPEGILKIKVCEDIMNLTECIQKEEGITVFYGEYYENYPNGKKALVKSTVEINLAGMPFEEREIYEKAVEIQDQNPETYGLKTEDELLDILIKGLNKEFVTAIRYVENAYSDLKTYGIFGSLIREG